MELTDGYLEGRLLIASPGIFDQEFAQTVIYVFKHDATGAAGLVMNQVSTHINFTELCNQLSIAPTNISLVEHTLCDGGPVEGNRGYVLHSDDFKGRDTQIFPNTGLALTTTVDIIRKLASGNGPKQAHIALGYVGWGAGQLEIEMQRHGWLYCHADKEILFNTPHLKRWQEAINKIGLNVNQLTDYSGHA